MNGKEAAGNIASNVVEGLKAQPLALALIVVNFMFLLGGLYAAKSLLNNIATAEAHRSELVKSLVEKCVLHENKP